VLTISYNHDGTLITRDRVNLTSSKARKRFLDHLEATEKFRISEDVLLALDAAVRESTVATDASENDDGSPPISETGPVSLASLEQKLSSHLLLGDPDALRVLLACVASHRLGGDPVWLLLVGPSSGAKTELLMLFSKIPGMVYLSDLTEKTLASGLSMGNEDPSLLARLKNETLILKDFTTVLSMPLDRRKEVFAQLREVYDGRYDKVWGTGKELHWEGRLGFVAGVTTVIDRHHAAISALGQRFVLLRVQQPDRNAVALRAMRNTDAEHQSRRREMATAVAAFVRQLPTAAPEVSDEHHRILAMLSDVVTRARSAVERDSYRRELDYTPEPEMPARFARQLLSLARGLALVGERPQTNDEDISTVIRVGLDSMPDVRRAVIEQLTNDDQFTVMALASTNPRYSETTLRRTLEDLQTLSLVTSRPTDLGDLWRLTPDTWKTINELHELRDMASQPNPPEPADLMPGAVIQASDHADSEDGHV
jgi:hypothetical protein